MVDTEPNECGPSGIISASWKYIVIVARYIEQPKFV